MTPEDRRLQRTLVEAIGFMELELPASAVQRLRIAADIGRANLQWNLLMGEALRAMERHQEALEPFQRACRLAPESIDVYLSLGWCYKRTEQLPLAIQALETAHKLEPNNDLVLYNLACYHSLAHHKPEALDYLARAFWKSRQWRALVPDESDFDNLRDDPDFQKLVRP